MNEETTSGMNEETTSGGRFDDVNRNKSAGVACSFVSASTAAKTRTARRMFSASTAAIHNSDVSTPKGRIKGCFHFGAVPNMQGEILFNRTVAPWYSTSKYNETNIKTVLWKARSKQYFCFTFLAT